jgi:hypothetical protein
MGKQLFANNASSKLFTIATAGTNKITVVHPDRFPSIAMGSGDFFYATIFSKDEEEIEVVKVTQTIEDVFIVERGLDGTEPRTWGMNTAIEMRPTAASMNDLYQYDIYDEEETLTNKIWLRKPVYRKLVDLGALPDSAIKHVPHGIQGTISFLPLQGVVPKAGFNLPSLTHNIDIYADSFNVYVLTNNVTKGVQAYAVLEYIKE